MKDEYIIWGIPKGEIEEQILFTKSVSEKHAKKVCDALEKQYHCTKLRIQTLSFKQNDVTDMFIKSINV
jgi:hypothetical protein